MTTKVEPSLSRLQTSLIDTQTQSSTATIARIDTLETSTADLLRQQSEAAQQTTRDILQGLDQVLNQRLPEEKLFSRLNDLENRVGEVKTATEQGSSTLNGQSLNLGELNTRLASLSLSVSGVSADLKRANEGTLLLRRGAQESRRHAQRNQAKLEEIRHLLSTMAVAVAEGRFQGPTAYPDVEGNAVGAAAIELARCIWLVFRALSVLVKNFM